MSKYLCICGNSFKRKKQADHHVKVYSEIQTNWPHQIMKQKWKGRLLDILINSRRYWKLTGIMIMYFTMMYHFGITLNLWEGLAMGCGLGLAIDW